MIRSINNKARNSVAKASTISFILAMVGIFLANGVSNAMKRLVYNHSGRSFRILSMQLVREYRALCGQDRKQYVSTAARQTTNILDMRTCERLMVPLEQRINGWVWSAN
jgi:hypothetical protein